MTEQTQTPLDYINRIEKFLSKNAKDFKRINEYENGILKEIKFVIVFYNTKVIVSEKQVRIMFSDKDIMYLEEGANDFGLAFNSDEGFEEFVTVRGFEFDVEIINDDAKAELVIRLIRTSNIEIEESKEQNQSEDEEDDEE